MAVNRGVLGSQTGSMGGITASNWKGRNVYKQKVPANNSSKTPAQVLQRGKFALLQKASRLLGPAIRIGFRSIASSVTEQNIFNSRNAQFVEQADGSFRLQGPGVTISSGTLLGLANFDATYVPATGIVTATWVDNSNGVDALPTDLVMLATIDEYVTDGAVSLGVATRSTGSATIQLGPFLRESEFQKIIYGFAKRATSTAVSPTAFAFYE